MESKVVRRRGRPNRGGGRFNRGRGRGRGSGPVPQQAQVSRGQHHGHGGRKGGSDFMADYEDGYSDEDYDYLSENTVVSRNTKSKNESSNSEGAMGRVPNSGRAGFSKQGSSAGRGSFQNR